MAENDSADNLHFLRDICDEFGEVRSFKWQCPGTYYINIECDESPVAEEFYLVETSADCISSAAKAYGKPLANHPEILWYRIDDPHGGRAIIQYEIARYRFRVGLPLFNNESLHTLAVYGSELNPEYFGVFPSPILTPRGLTTRYKAIVNGVFALETDRAETMIAICYPIWDANISDYTMKFSEQTATDLRDGIHSTMGYLFFPAEHGALALFELLSEFPQILTSDTINAGALYNAVWFVHPEYAAIYNREEQSGSHDALGLLLRHLYGDDIDLNVSAAHMIKFDLNAGTDYLRL